MTNQQVAATQATQAVQQVNTVFNGIKLSIQEIAKKSTEIALTSAQQLQVTEKIAASFDHAAELSKQTTEAAQTNMVSASSLTGVSENLHELVARFRLS